MNQIGDYALIGDCHSAALVGKDGSIDWACFPRFDSPSVFGRILDESAGGFFRICPAGALDGEGTLMDGTVVQRRYLPNTNVLVSRFEIGEAILEVTDCMPVRRYQPEDASRVRGFGAILRKVQCIAGNLDVRVSINPRFEYGSFTPRFRATSERTIEVVGGADALWITTTHPLPCTKDSLDTIVSLTYGETMFIEAAWSVSHEERLPEEHPSGADLAERLESTVEFWHQWIGQCRYIGEFEEPVRRSALVLKMLTYAPTGAVVAAPTTSLPEEIGGVRNWDYRYTWIRDTTLTLISLLVLGFRAEADDYRQWFRRTSAGRAEDLQIMYGIDGTRSLPEIELSHLAGHRGSKPVRIGNGAVKQMQLDVYGSILQIVYIYVKTGGTVTETNWEFLRGLADIVCERWEKPDQGIWEIRDEPRHFIHSKLLCWAALDRAVKLSERNNLPGDRINWKNHCERVREYLMEEGARPGWFPQSVGSEAADASSLLVPAMGFLPPKHPAVLATIENVRDQLENDGLVYRYLAGDGLDGHEGGFLLCSFWLLDALIHSGRLDESEKLLQRLLALENDVGLYAEEAIPESGEALGNFPQAFTHMALVTSCAHLSAARRGALPPDGTAYDFAEFALSQLR